MATLFATLELGLQQCQEQLKTIQDQAKRIERLYQENEELKLQLQTFANGEHTVQSELSSAKFNALMQENFELKAEIGILRQEVKRDKDQTSELGPRSSRLSLPTPTAASVTQTSRSSSNNDSPQRENLALPSGRKRLRTTSPTGSFTHSTSGNDRKSEALKHPAEVKVETVVLSSDDEERGEKTPKPLDGKEAMHLHQRQSDSRSFAKPYVDYSPAGSILNPKHTPRPHQERRQKPVIATEPILEKAVPSDPRYRSLPLEKLSMSHFRRNPEFVDSWDCTVDEIVRGRRRHECSVACAASGCEYSGLDLLISTLPSRPSYGQNGESLTDDELLRGFLGPNSEDRIAKLTPMARQNLVQEARTKLVSSVYKRRRADADRPPTPPGFWNIDMPSSQEECKNNDNSRKQVSKEIKMRYQEAMRGSSRWIFADECKSAS